VELGPSEDKPKLTPAEGAVDDLELINAHLGLAVGVTCVEVRIAVVVEVSVPPETRLQGGFLAV
jgi:hypothetical protein